MFYSIFTCSYKEVEGKEKAVLAVLSLVCAFLSRVTIIFIWACAQEEKSERKRERERGD